ncbi:TlpA family protein disulfide reductase [Mucilaginibacter sp. 14171R-50]|uniref:TlpA family protein disulfide reductase n=1 Tax=Mucilaginibacter sp. 14171R-50 TaxID=2703789 RepID=UPI00138C7C3D|nr:TlpA disulfide reductase family protein [Mucilaginibacter sp. 14171R-50]QHS54820.1 TlpA family protein disulfide reductase [Mucilaginibacter sp. 14171R-50]
MKFQFLNKLTLSRLINALFIVVIALLIFNPKAKAVMIQGLMKIGLFQPDIAESVTPAGATALPAVVFEGTDGKTVSLADHKGKVIFINFWATWCPPCIAEMPTINALHEKLKNNPNIVFMTVDADGNLDRSAMFMNKHHYSLPLYKAGTDVPPGMFGNTLPTTVIFDKSGKMVFRHEGTADFSNPKVMAYLLQIAN